MKIFKIKICMLAFFICAFPPQLWAGEVSCRLYSDHNTQEDIGAISDTVSGIADLIGGAASSISDIASVVGLGSNLKSHKIYCTYTEKNEQQENSNQIFYNLMKNGDVIPVFLYENIAQKKVERCPLNEVNTPFLSAESRDKSAKVNEFVFNSRTALSNIKYFGFIQPKTNNIIMYTVNPKTLQLREPSYKQWTEINEEYLK